MSSISGNTLYRLHQPRSYAGRTDASAEALAEKTSAQSESPYADPTSHKPHNAYIHPFKIVEGGSEGHSSSAGPCSVCRTRRSVVSLISGETAARAASSHPWRGWRIAARTKADAACPCAIAEHHPAASRYFGTSTL